MKISASVWALVGVVAFTGAARAQSLAEVARKEAERRQTIKSPARVYTDADLRPVIVTTQPVSPSAEAATPAGTGGQPAAKPDAAAAAATLGSGAAQATPTEPSVDLGEQYWRKLMADARDALARSSSYLQALQERARALMTQFYTLEDPVARNNAATERNKVLDDIDHLKQTMVAQEETIAKIEADARKANVPPGWIR